MITASHPTVDVQIPTRQHRARSAVARASSSRLILTSPPVRESIFECPTAPLTSIAGLNLLLWACVATWWIVSAPALVAIPS